MAENKKLSADISEAGDQPRAILVRFAPEVAAQVEADAQGRKASPTEIVRSIVCEHYSGTSQGTDLMRELRELIEDRFRHLVYEISRTRSSLYNVVEQSGTFGLDRDKLKQIQQWSREDASEYLGRLDAEMRRRMGLAETGGEVRKE
ncbi:MAG TPA: hypothetical protein VMV27_00835 [Candidatus Binataceae bacterium]|nr:hypothetical protein [Candidatus Binataceae bacterium]HUZ73813.1 hypothetical protein [Stellaceae bacterium]